MSKSDQNSTVDLSARLRRRWAKLALAEQDRPSVLCDGDRSLRYRLPELRVVAEKDASPAPFQRLQPVQCGGSGFLDSGIS